MAKFPTTRSDGKPVIRFQMIAPETSAIAKIVFIALPGTIVRNVHRKLLSKIAAKAKTIMKQEIQKQFRISDAHKPRADGQPRIWQTPTGALHNSIGVKIPSLSQMRNGLVAFAAVGPRSDFKASKNVRKRVNKMKTFSWNTEEGTPFFTPRAAPPNLHIGRGPKGEDIVRPVRYAHLANFGHTPGGSRIGIHAKAHDYMTPTQTRVEAVIGSIIDSNYQTLLVQTFDRDTASRLRALSREVVG